MAPAVACIGFMGAGKSTAARSLAQALGTQAIDVDSVVEERLGKPIERVFAEDGEATFREAEERITLELLSQPEPGVLALGGGAITHERVRTALRAHTVVWLDVALDVAWTRCRDSDRPLARDREQFEALYHQREPLYAELADATVPAERSNRMEPVLEALGNIPQGTKLLWATSASADYPAYIGNGLLTEHRFWPGTVAGRRFLVTDGAVGRLYSELLEPHSARIAIMPGEQSKTIAHAEIVWTELVRAGMTRADVVVGARWRSRGRSGRVLRGDLPARRALRAGADHSGGAGRLSLRRQDRRRPGRGQELCGRFPPAQCGARRHRRPSTRSRTPSWRPATRRWSRLR